MPVVFRQLLYAFAAGLALGAASLAGYAAWVRFSTPTVIAGAPPAGCDLQREPCRARFPGGGEMIVTLAPQPIPVLKPVHVSVELLDLRADSVEVDLSSPDMYMGYNRRPLRALATDHYAGHTVLPVCILDRMRWTLRAIARSDKTVHEAAFEFETMTNRARAPE